MEGVTGQILAFAVGVGLSVFPIIAIILMLCTPRGRTNGPAFLAGWLAGIVAVGAIILALSNSIDLSKSGPGTGASWFKIGLGVLLLFAAFRQWRRRPACGEEPQMPGWMAALDKVTWPKSFGLAALLSGVNPKNLALIAAAAATVAQSGAAMGQQVLASVVFVVIATVGVALPLVVYLAMGERAVKILDEWKSWLAMHNAAIMVVLFLVFAAKLIGDGITGLS